MADEARHVAFGVLSLQELLPASCRPPRCASARSSPSRRPCGCGTAAHPGGLGPPGRAPKDVGRSTIAARTRPGRLPGAAVLQDRPEREEARAARRRRRLAADEFTEMGVIAFEDLEDTDEERRRRRPTAPRCAAGRLSRHRRPGLRSPGPRGPAGTLSRWHARRPPVRRRGRRRWSRPSTETARSTSTPPRAGPLAGRPRSDGLVVSGTTGEGPVLTDDEKVDLWRGGGRGGDRPGHRRLRQQRHRALGRADPGGRRGRRRRPCWS